MKYLLALEKSRSKIAEFQRKYGVDSQKFYREFISGQIEESAVVPPMDRIRWAGEIDIVIDLVSAPR